MNTLVRPSRLALLALINIVLLSNLQAQLTASKISLSFGIVPTGMSKVDSFYVKNNYTSPDTVTAVNNSQPSIFAISAKSGSLTRTIVAGDSVWYYVTFTPSAITNYSDLVNFVHTSDPANPTRVALSGQGVEHLFPSKLSIPFGTIVVSKNKVDSFYIKNRSTTAYTISAVAKNTAAYSITPKTILTGPINGGDSLWYYVTFTPTAASSYPDTVKVTHNSNAVNPLSIVLSGTGDVQLVSTKTSLAFGTVFVGTTKKDSFYVKSRGSSTDTIKTVGHGRAKDSTLFTFALPGALPYAITPGDSAKIVVTFGPDTTRAYVDTVVVGHSALASPIRVPMSGTGDAQLAASKTAIAFGAVAANTPKADSFYVKNRSTGSFAISGVTTNTAKYVVTAKSGNMTPTLAAGDSAWYYVTFTPDTIKSFPDTVKIAHNAFGVNPIRIVLSGTGDVQLISTKTPLAYGTVLVGSTKADSFYVKNRSNTNYTINAISNAQTARFVLSATPGVLNAGDSLKVKVTFTPDSVGNMNDTVTVTHNAPFGSPLKVPMSGTGGNPLRLVNRTGATVTVLAMVDTFANKLRKDSVYIRNVGGSGFNVTSVTISNPEFRVITQPTTVAAGDSQKIVIGYVASSVGRDVDTLRIVHNSTIPGSSPILLPVQARGLGSFAWSTVSAGTPLDTHVVRINATNTGTTPGTVAPPLAVDSVRSLTVFLRNNQDRFDPASAILRVDSIKFKTSSFYSVMPVPFSIRPDLFDVYQVLLQFRFQPKVASTSIKDTAFLFTNDTVPGGSIVRIPVEGSSRNVAYILTQNNRQDMNFGSVPVFGASADSAVRVHNYKTTGTTIDSVRLAAKNPFFKFDTVSLYKRVLAQGDTSRILVRFAPTDTTPTVGGVNRDTLLIYNTGSGLANPYKIPLAGSPSLGIAQLPNVTSINFGEQTVGIFRDSVIKIYNRTKANYRIDSVALNQGQHFSIQSNVLVTQMNAGDSTSIIARFTPLSGGTFTDTLYVYHTFPTTLFANPRKITLTGSGSTQQLISAANYETRDNVEGAEGVPIASVDSSYKEKGNFWNNTGGSFGTGHRRSPNLSGSHFGSEATWTFKIDSTKPYLIYHFLLNSPNVGGGFYVYFRKFGIGGIYDSIRYNGFANRTFTPGVGGTWIPLMMHRIDGVGLNAASVSIGADEKSGGFLRVDAIRMLRSQQRRDIEFGRRTIAFASGRVPEEFPEVTLGDSLIRPYRLYNLGYDTLTITNVEFFKTTGSTADAPRFFVKGYTPGTQIKVPPMTVNAQNQEVGGYYDLQLVFAPFQEEIVRDSMVITSNDDSEPKASIVLNGQGINYYFIMNASLGNTEPHFRAPTPGQGGVTTLPIYRETANGSWVNSTLAAVTYPIPGGNVSSRVNVGGTATLPHQAFYEFELPDLAFGRIPTDGNYILEYGGPAGSPNGYSLSQTIVTQSFGIRPDTGYYSGTTPSTHLWLQIGGSLKTFPMFPGGKITVEIARTAQTDAAGGVGVLRTDLLRVRKVPTGALIGVSRVAPDSLYFGEVNFRSPGGIDGKANKRVLTIGSRGEKALRVSQLRFRDGRFFRLAPAPALPFDLPAINGNYNLTIEFLPNKIAPYYRDTLEVYSNSSRQDTLLLVPMTGVGIGQSFVIHDDGIFNTEIAAVPFPGELYLSGWKSTNLKSWYVHAVNTSDSIGLGKTRRLLPIYANHAGWFEWYPLLPTASGSDSMLVRIFATVTANATNLSPAARYKVWSTGGRLTLDTTINQNGRAVTRQGVAEIDLGSHYILRGGRDAAGGAAVFGHIRVENDTSAVTAFYGAGTNIAKRDTFGLVADAVILRELESPGTATGVDEVKDLPREYTLSQNYPNPFNPTTTVEFTLPERVGVSLKIYDILGREVATLLNGEEMNPGRYTVRWLGRTDYGIPVATGVYFYRIVAGGFVQVKKMVLIR